MFLLFGVACTTQKRMNDTKEQKNKRTVRKEAEYENLDWF